MTLSDLLSALYADLGYVSAPASAVTTRLTRYLNEGYHTVLSLPGFQSLRFSTISFASVASQTIYGVPQLFQQISAIVDTTNNIRLRRMSRDEYRSIDPQELSSGTPSHYIEAGTRPVQYDPVSKGLWVVSSAGGDTTQTAALLGARAGGLPTTLQTATLNGTTRVAVGSFTDYVSVLQFELSAVAVGAVSLYDAAAAGNQLAVIAIGQKTVTYQALRLWPTPSAAITYNVDGLVNLTDLAQTYDAPLVPVDFQYLLLEYGRMREYEFRDDDRLPAVTASYARRLAAFRARVCDPPDFRPVAGRLIDRGSSLGPWYPAGRW